MSGTVMLDGKLVDGTVVVFQDETDKTMSYGLTNTSGNFSLEFDSEKSGCTPGLKVVQVSTKRKILGPNTSESDGESDADAEAEGAAPAEELIPACYNKESKLHVEVSSPKTSFEFDLKTDCSTNGAK